MQEGCFRSALMSTHVRGFCTCTFIMEIILHAPTANDLIVRRKAGPSPIDCLHPNVLVFKSVSKLTKVLLSDISSTASHIFNQHQLLSHNHFLPWLLFSFVTQCKRELLYVWSVCMTWYR